MVTRCVTENVLDRYSFIIHIKTIIKMLTFFVSNHAYFVETTEKGTPCIKKGLGFWDLVYSILRVKPRDVLAHTALLRSWLIDN